MALLLLLSLAPGLSTATDKAEVVRLTDCTLLISWDGEFTPAEKEKLHRWLTVSTDTMLLLNGTWPRDEIRIELQPLNAAEAVPFARVLRRNPQGVRFYVNPSRTLDEFITDWTAYHEFTHLFIPYPGMADVWFSEGLASYYQNILQYRAGLITAEDAKAKLRQGFERGRDNNQHNDLTLTQLSDRMHERRAYMRVYWSGALYFLEADLALRSGTDGSPDINTLDDVLREYGECCLNSSPHTGEDIAREFDRIAGRQLFTRLYDRYSQSTAIPDFEPMLDSRGMESILPARSRAAKLSVQ